MYVIGRMKENDKSFFHELFWNSLILIKNSDFESLMSQQKYISYFLLPQQCNNSLLFQR